MRHISLIISLLILLITIGCVREEIEPDGNGNGTVSATEPFTLTFTVGIPSMGTDGGANTRAIFYGNPLYYEDWIDTQNGLRVLFFISKRQKTGNSYVAGQYADNNNYVAVDPINPLKDYFLFESTSRWVTQLPYDDDNNLRYRVTVPVYQIGNEDTEYREYWDKIREILRTYDFKIAILANHPSSFTWTIQNSVLSVQNIDDLSNATNVKTINDIHHSVADNNYSNGGDGRQDAYAMLVDSSNKINGYSTMGPYIDWVTTRSALYGDALGGKISSKETARTWIRDHWIPELKYNEKTDPDIDFETLYHDYRYLWSYWNFGGAAADNALPYTDKSTTNTHLNDWEVRNGALLRDWVSSAVENGGVFQNDLSTASTTINKYDGSDVLTFYPSTATAVITSSNGKRFYGVQLPKLSATPTSTTAKDCFLFKLRTHGTVTVRYQNLGGTLYVTNGTTRVSASSTSSKTVNGVKIYESQYSISVPGDPTNCFVFSMNGATIVHDIEFTEDEYLQLTDREGILPSSDHPIPMYGVQKYAKLDGYWEEGAAFDLTEGGTNENGTDYPSKTISLLRAVAKIELLIPKSLGVPKHVYMRSLNRHVRCEPMDVSTPTNELWKDHNHGCEWKDIQARGSFYEGGITVDKYKKRLAWYYGSWKEWGWKFNGYNQYIPDDSDGPFPRIMNPYINRSDFAAFIDVSDYYNDQFYHFLFYMGESPLDAPHPYNGSSGSPKVPHIELRFDERYAATSKVSTNTDINLEDDDCYRIYFTEGGIASGARDANGVSKIGKKQYESQYENNTSYISEHWPIIRNHIYRFTVLDAGADNMNGLVVDVQDRTTDFNFK